MKILIDNKAAIALKYYTKFAEGEVSGMGKTEITEDGDILVTDLFLFDQECTGSTTELDDQAQAKFLLALHNDGGDAKNWNLWWHTHADFSVFWSGQDDKCIADHMGSANNLVSVVTNKKGDFKGRLDLIPEDTSGYGKKFAPMKYDLDVDVLVNTEQKNLVEKRIETIKEEKESIEELIKEYDKQIEEERDSLLEDNVLKEECKSIVAEKVRKKVSRVPITSYKYDYKNVYKGGKFKQLDKKKTYFDKDYSRSKKFEDALDEIQWAAGDDKEYKELYDEMKYSTACPECGNMIAYCRCKDALEKYPDALDEDYEEYLFNSFSI